ncbi:hypothetical protein LXL04_030262 [Taraxacum kok-saghyz]
MCNPTKQLNFPQDSEQTNSVIVVAETCWLRNLLHELLYPPLSATLVYCDNVSAVYLSTNPVQYQRTKHIRIDLHFVRDKVAMGHIRVLHVPSASQYADIFTKGLPSTLFLDFRSSLNVRSRPPVTTAGDVSTQLYTHPAVSDVAEFTASDGVGTGGNQRRGKPAANREGNKYHKNSAVNRLRNSCIKCQERLFKCQQKLCQQRLHKCQQRLCQQRLHKCQQRLCQQRLCKSDSNTPPQVEQLDPQCLTCVEQIRISFM